jgi:hypothetical protein
MQLPPEFSSKVGTAGEKLIYHARNIISGKKKYLKEKRVCGK